MSSADAIALAIGFVKGLLSSTVIVLALFIGFCVVIGFAKLKRTRGDALVVKSLAERVNHRAFEYLPPTAPRGPADQLRTPELVEPASRK